MQQKTVLFLGDFDSGHSLHEATRRAVLEAAADRGVVLNTRWMGPEHLALYPGMVAESSSVVLAPPAPRTSRAFPESMIPALRTIREQGIPFLATGEGHGLVFIEAARTLLDLPDAGSSAYEGSGADPVVDRLPRADDGETGVHDVELEIEAGASPYGDLSRATEPTDIEHGLNPDYATRMTEAGFRVAARDRNGGRPYLHVLDGHPYHVTAAFLPQLSSWSESPHPLIAGLVEACVAE